MEGHAWRLYREVQDDRILLVAAGVTLYGLLALFPATAALVSLYGLFADAATINEHFRLLAGFLPDGALEVIGDQVRRIAAEGQARWGSHFSLPSSCPSGAPMPAPNPSSTRSTSFTRSARSAASG